MGKCGFSLLVTLDQSLATVITNIALVFIVNWRFEEAQCRSKRVFLCLIVNFAFEATMSKKKKRGSRISPRLNPKRKRETTNPPGYRTCCCDSNDCIESMMHYFRHVHRVDEPTYFPLDCTNLCPSCRKHLWKANQNSVHKTGITRFVAVKFLSSTWDSPKTFQITVKSLTQSISPLHCTLQNRLHDYRCCIIIFITYIFFIVSDYCKTVLA